MNLKVEDLRKDNYLELDGEIVSVRAINQDEDEYYLSVVHGDGFVDEYHVNSFEPLHIEDKWLVKLGFNMSEVWKDLVLEDGDGRVLTLSTSNNWFVLTDEMAGGISNAQLLEFLQQAKTSGEDIENIGYIPKKQSIVLGNIGHVHLLQNIIQDFYKRKHSLEYV